MSSEELCLRLLMELKSKAGRKRFAAKVVRAGFRRSFVGSLGSALWFLIRDKGNSDRTVKALTVRISLSIALFLLLMAGYYFNIIPRNGLH